MSFTSREEFQALGRIRAATRYHPDQPELAEADREFLREHKRRRAVEKLASELAAAIRNSDEKRQVLALIAPLEFDGDAA